MFSTCMTADPNRAANPPLSLTLPLLLSLHPFIFYIPLNFFLFTRHPFFPLLVLPIHPLLPNSLLFFVSDCVNLIELWRQLKAYLISIRILSCEVEVEATARSCLYRNIMLHLPTCYLQRMKIDTADTILALLLTYLSWLMCFENMLLK